MDILSFMTRLLKSMESPWLGSTNPSSSAKAQQLFIASPIRLVIKEIRGDMKIKSALIAARVGLLIEKINVLNVIL